MQVYVSKAALSATVSTPIIALYADGQAIPSGAHPNTTLLNVIDPSCIKQGTSGYVLDPSWRNGLTDMINAEAARRITVCFPEYAQRNAANTTLNYNHQYGMDRSVWPVAALQQQAEIDRGWAFVNQVRAASNSLIPAAPLDPTDDSHWPAPITPIQLYPT